MTNLECVIETLAAHREARRWSDDAVAADVLARLGLDPAADVAGGEQNETDDEQALPGGSSSGPVAVGEPEPAHDESAPSGDDHSHETADETNTHE